MTTPSAEPRPIHEVLKDIRRVLAPPGELAFTQRRLAKELGVTAKYFQKMERGTKPFLLHHFKDLAHLRPTDEQRAREFDALMEELRALLLPSLGRALAVPPDARAQLDALAHALGGVHQQLDEAAAKREVNTREILRAVWTSTRLVGLIGLFALVVVCGARYGFHTGGSGSVEAARVQQSAPSLASASAPPIIILANVAQGGAPLAFNYQSFLGAVGTIEMGEKRVDQAIPERPLPGQKVPPCLGEAYEDAINGGCWVGILNAKPPCGRYAFRSGDKCYRPVSADPTKPVGGSTLSPDPSSQLAAESRPSPTLAE